MGKIEEGREYPRKCREEGWYTKVESEIRGEYFCTCYCGHMITTEGIKKVIASGVVFNKDLFWEWHDNPDIVNTKLWKAMHS